MSTPYDNLQSIHSPLQADQMVYDYILQKSKLEILKNEAENSRKDSENLLIEYKKEIKSQEKLLEQLRS